MHPAETRSAPPQAPEPAHEQTLLGQYLRVRSFTTSLCAGLAPEDQVVQSMEDVSPTKWHLAHTSWFFETFVLAPHAPGYRPYHPEYGYLFNSYYTQAGERHCRAQRGYLSRPTVAEVHAYRAHVDGEMERLLTTADAGLLDRIAPLVTLGINHEQQHQELLVTDIKHVFSVNPLRPAYRERREASAPMLAPAAPPLHWIGFEEGVRRIGHDGEGFAYDNEGPRHRVFLEAFELASRPATNGEFLAFMEDGGYRRPELWLSAGWAAVQENAWSEPFYWERRDGRWWSYTVEGMREVAPHEPVCHLSYFEADAFARWAGARLPGEAEWEVAAAGAAVEGNLAERLRFHPLPTPAAGREEPVQLYGDVWEWTRSQYSAYPGYAPAAGAIGEYNGKFMCNQFVLRGGSCATSRSHIRATYRNFFPPDATWQFTGARLARHS
jgi:ergothioneine biosynthesis protein EgtB